MIAAAVHSARAPTKSEAGNWRAPAYSVFYLCSASKVHTMGLTVTLEAEIGDWSRIQDVYAGHPIPPQIMTMELNEFQCPETGRTVIQQDNN